MSVVRFSEIPLLETDAGNHQAAEQLLTRMQHLEIPGFVIRQAGATQEAAVAALEPVWQSRGVLHRSVVSTTFGKAKAGTPAKQSDGLEEPVLHVDARPNHGPLMLFNMHHTSKGQARTYMAVPTAAFAATCSLSLPRGTAARFSEGYINPGVIAAVHTADVAAGDLTVFALGGPRPTAHCFVTQGEEQRQSTAVISALPRLGLVSAV